MKPVTFEQAREAVRAVNEPAWEDADTPGTYMVAEYGYEDADAFLILDGAKEFLVDDDGEYAVEDAPAMLVEKATGLVMAGDFLNLQERIMAMTPVGDVPDQD